MEYFYRNCFLSVFFICVGTVFAQSSIDNFLNQESILLFDSEEFHLGWSKDSNNYYKQEYLRLCDEVGVFSKMILIETPVGSDMHYR